MPDPRWSAQEITQEFSNIKSIQRSLDSVIGIEKRRNDQLQERIDVLEARVAELEEALDEL